MLFVNTDIPIKHKEVLGVQIESRRKRHFKFLAVTYLTVSVFKWGLSFFFVKSSKPGDQMQVIF